MKETWVVWGAIALLCLCLLFPPYGYSRFTVIALSRTVTVAPTITEVNHGWIYLGHFFLCSRPPAQDPVLISQFRDTAELTNEVVLDDVGIGWYILGVECVIILAITGGAVFAISRP